MTVQKRSRTPVHPRAPRVAKWSTLHSRDLLDLRIFNARQVRRVSPRTGNEHDFIVLDAPDWVNIIAVTPRRELVFVEQYRHGTGQITLEIPGGMVDPGESPGKSARRELLEETGYGTRSRLRSLGHCTPNPAFLSNRCHTFVLDDVEKIREPSLDSGEDIRVTLVPEKKIPELIRAGKIHNSLVLVGLALYFHWR